MADGNKVVVQLIANLEEYKAQMQQATQITQQTAASMQSALSSIDSNKASNGDASVAKMVSNAQKEKEILDTSLKYYQRQASEESAYLQQRARDQKKYLDLIEKEEVASKKRVLNEQNSMLDNMMRLKDKYYSSQLSSERNYSKLVVAEQNQQLNNMNRLKEEYYKQQSRMEALYAQQRVRDQKKYLDLIERQERDTNRRLVSEQDEMLKNMTRLKEKYILDQQRLSNKANSSAIKEQDEMLKNMMRLRSAAEGSANGHHLNAIAIRESMVVMRELSRGDMTRLVGSLSILAQQFEFTKAIITGFFNPAILATTFVVGSLTYTFISAQKEQREFNDMLQVTGNSAGLTGSTYQLMASRISNSMRVSESVAKEALGAIAKSSLLAKGNIEGLAETAIIFGRKTGEGTDQALKRFLAMKDGATKAARDIVLDGYNLLTSAQIEEIRKLEDTGRAMEAQQLLQDDLNKSLKKLGDQTTTLEQDWQRLGASISNAYVEFKKWMSGTETSGDKILKLQEKIKLAKERMDSNKDNPFGGADYKAAMNDMLSATNELSMLQQKVNREQKDAEKERDRAAREQQDVRDRMDDEHYRKNSERLENEIKKTNAKFLREKNIDIERARSRKASEEEITRIIQDNEQRREEEIKQKKRRFAPIQDKKTSSKGQVTEAQMVRGDLLEYLNTQEQAAIDANKIYLKRNQDTITFYQNEIVEMKKYHAKAREIKAVENQLLNSQLMIKKEVQSREIAQDEAFIRNTSINIDKRIAKAEELKRRLFDSKLPVQDQRYYEIDNEETKLKEKKINDAIRLANEEKKEEQTLELEKIDDLRASYKTQLTEHKIKLTKYIEYIKEAAKEELKIKQGVIDAEIAAEKSKGGNSDPVKIKQLENAKLALASKTNKDLLNLTQQATKDYMKPWDDAFKHLGDSFSSNIEKMLKKQQSFGQAFKYTLGDMVTYGIQVSEQIAVNWIRDRLTEALFSKTIQSTTGASKVLSNASVAGSAAYASTAAIPIVGPGLAPAAGLAAYTGALSYLGMASAEQGTIVPSNVAEMPAFIHRDEKVLPADERHKNDEMYRMLKSGNFGKENSSNQNNQEMSVNFHINAIDSRGVKDFFDNNGKLIANSLKNHMKTARS